VGRVFQGEKILSTPSFEGEVKPSHVADLRHGKGPESSMELTTFRPNLPAISRPIIPPFTARFAGVVVTCRTPDLVVQVGTSKISGCTISLQTAVHPGGISCRDPTKQTKKKTLIKVVDFDVF
jgi:hypothetical protein